MNLFSDETFFWIGIYDDGNEGPSFLDSTPIKDSALDHLTCSTCSSNNPNNLGLAILVEEPNTLVMQHYHENMPGYCVCESMIRIH